MARELSAAEWQALSPDEKERRLRHRAQHERETLTIHDVDLANIYVDLSGHVGVKGRGTATAHEVASALDRSPILHAILDAVAAARRVIG